MVSRRFVLGSTAVALAVGAGIVGVPIYRQLYPAPAEIGFELTEEELARALAFLAVHPAIDSHAHPGRTFVDGAKGLTWKLRLYAMQGTFENSVIEDMMAGGVAAAGFAAVADFPVLDAGMEGLSSVRAFEVREAWAYYQAQISNLRALIDSGLVYEVLRPADVAAAQAAGKPGAILSVEGADFLENDLSRVEKAKSDGVRLITLVHYLKGGFIGDIMTAEPVHNGLTGFGREALVELQRSGIMVDLAHASEKTAFDALALSTKPVVATHTHISQPNLTSTRFVSLELAQAIADGGGFIGAWPAGIGISTMEQFLERIEELVVMLGEDHVALGSDMDANFKPVWDNYSKTPFVVGGLLKRGMSEEVVAKVMGGNFLRVFGGAQAG